jgi:hypothetical protein
LFSLSFFLFQHTFFFLGSGKSYVADLIKVNQLNSISFSFHLSFQTEEELQSKGNNKPKIFSIDNYFLTESQRETKDLKTGKITKTSVGWKFCIFF